MVRRSGKRPIPTLNLLNDQRRSSAPPLPIRYVVLGAAAVVSWALAGIAVAVALGWQPKVSLGP